MSKYIKIKELDQTNNTTYLLIKEISERETKTKKLYLMLSLTDGEEDITAKMWDTGREQFQSQVGEVIQCWFEIKEYMGQPDYTLRDYRATVPQEVDATQFAKHSPIDPKQMYADILQKVSLMNNEEIKKLTLYVLEDNKEKLLHWAAGKRCIIAVLVN